MLTNKNITLRTRITFLNGFVRSRLTYGCHAWRPTQAELSKLNATYNKFLRSMIWNGFKRKQEHCNYNDENTTEIDWSYKITNEKLYEITNTVNITTYYEKQQKQWIAHVIRRENNHPCKMLTFHTNRIKRRGRKVPSMIERTISSSKKSKGQFLSDCLKKNNS